ncbi:MAG: hypothetical protein ACU0AT_09070 [Tranquillimonas sp.]
MTPTLRDRLRNGTVSQHARVDRLFSRFDLGTGAGLVLFYRATLAATGAVACASGPHRAEAERLRDETIEALAGDLADLGGDPAPAPRAEALDATAVYYVLLGSRLGKRLLERRWRMGAAAAGPARYFALPDRKGDWRDLCRELSGRPARGAPADTILRDADRLFTIFADAAQTVIAEEPLHV